MTPFRLLSMRRFAPFFVAQFLGVFDDHLYRNALIVLFSFQLLPPDMLGNPVAGIFILPVFLFSGIAGQLADKYDKAKLIRFVKILEMLAMGVAAAGFVLHSIAVLFSALFLLGLASTLFGPVRYAIMPQHLSREELVGGNALVASGLFVSILIGTAAGSLLAGSGEHPVWIAMAGFLAAFLGFLASCRIPPVPESAPDLTLCLNPVTGTLRNIGFSRENRTVFMAIIGVAWFWLYGVLLMSLAPVFARNVLGGDEGGITLLLAIFTGGICLGSILCVKLSGRRVEIGLAPFGAFGMMIFGLDLFLMSPDVLPAGAPLSVTALLCLAGTWRVLFDLLAIGFFGGFFIVPLYVLMQSKSEPERRARIIAASNILNAAFIVAGAFVAAALLALGASIPLLLGIAALCNGLAALYVSRRVPEHLIRFVASIMIHSVYRLNKRGLEQIPDEGPAVLVFNHVSFIDPVVVMAAIRRPIRFVMDHAIYRLPIAHSIFRCARTIPIAPAKEDPAIKEKAFVEVAEALRAGDLVGLFPEGRITRDGELNPFRYGVQRITSETPVPVIPMALRGLWGSFFSRRYGPAMRVPSCIRPFRKIELVADVPVPPQKADPAHLQELVESLRGDFR